MKSKLDQMIHLLNQRDDSAVLPKGKFSKLGKHSAGDRRDSESVQDVETELISLKVSVVDFV